MIKRIYNTASGVMALLLLTACGVTADSPATPAESPLPQSTSAPALAPIIAATSVERSTPFPTPTWIPTSTPGPMATPTPTEPPELVYPDRDDIYITGFHLRGTDSVFPQGFYLTDGNINGRYQDPANAPGYLKGPLLSVFL